MTLVAGTIRDQASMYSLAALAADHYAPFFREMVLPLTTKAELDLTRFMRSTEAVSFCCFFTPAIVRACFVICFICGSNSAA